MKADPIVAKVYSRVSKLKSAHGLTWKELAERAGLQDKAVIEQLRRNPRIILLDRIAKALGVSLCYLLCSEEVDATPKRDMDNAKTLRKLADANIVLAMEYFEEIKKRGHLGPRTIDVAIELGLI